MPPDFLATSILASRDLLVRYLKGFDDSNHVSQAPSLPNHVAWNLGHLALTMLRVAQFIDGNPIPTSDFMTGSDRGDAHRFGTESVSFGSAPTSDAARYPGYARCVEIFSAACERLARAASVADDASLARMVRWGNADVTVRSLLPRMIFHNGMHTGQIADLRRALRMGSALG